MLLEAIRNFNKNGASLDELVELSALARLVKTEFGELEAPVPKWFEDKVVAIRTQVSTLVEADKAHRIQKIHAELRGLRTAEERRADLRKELEALGGAITTEDKNEPAAV
jgi:hypothetical protein